MAEQINPIGLNLSQVMGEEEITASFSAPPAERVNFSGNPFEDFLSQAVKSLEGISHSEITANQMIDAYLNGQVELQEVMVAQAKMNIMVQLAVTTITSTVNTFKEVTQMQV